MNTDAFTTAARAEAGTLYAVDWDTPAYYDEEDRQEAEQFLAGAEWARDHLAAHSDLTVDSETVTVESDEPTDAEVEAAKAEGWQEGVNFALPNAETTWYPQHNPYRATLTEQEPRA